MVLAKVQQALTTAKADIRRLEDEIEAAREAKEAEILSLSCFITWIQELRVSWRGENPKRREAHLYAFDADGRQAWPQELVDEDAVRAFDAGRPSESGTPLVPLNELCHASCLRCKTPGLVLGFVSDMSCHGGEDWWEGEKLLCLECRRFILLHYHSYEGPRPDL